MNRLAQLISFYEEDPEDEFILFALAQEYQKLGNLAQALQFYETCHRLHPNYVGNYYHLAKAYLKLGQTDDARSIILLGMQCAESQSDFHSKAELQNLYTNIDLGLIDD